MTKKIIGIAGNQLLQAAEVFHGNQVITPHKVL